VNRGVAEIEMHVSVEAEKRGKRRRVCRHDV
jgi:hypothetical protein